MKKKTKIAQICILVITLLLTAFPVRADDLEGNFRNPPDSTRPWCYWYWMSGNISKEGITRDLEAMSKVGIGSALIGNIGLTEPLKGSVKVLSEEWWDMMGHAVREASRTGVDIGVFNSPGWSQSGGPWIKPEQAMRYIVRSETVVKGPLKFSAKLPVPTEPYMDLTVLAFPRPAEDGDNAAARKPAITCSKGDAPEKLVDGDLASVCKFAENSDEANPVSVLLDFKTAFTARSLTVKPAPAEIDVGARLEVSDDGSTWRQVRTFKIDRSNPSVNVGFMPFGAVCVVFPETSGRYWRVMFPGKLNVFELAELDLSAAARTEFFVEKQLGKTFQDPIPPCNYYSWPDQPGLTRPALAIRPEQVVDISSMMTVDGTLTWDVPDGEWVIQRMGLTPTGTRNAPASPDATGLECDKMNKKHIAAHFEAHLGELLRRLPANERKAFKYCVADSYEQGAQDWTDGFGELFNIRYGYDPKPFLPALSGRVVNTPEMTDRFLWDLRRLVADEVAQGYVGGLREVANRNGLKLWLENYGHWGFPSESLLYGKYSDLVGGEFWYDNNSLGALECRLAASAVHVYGKKICYAEAFTSNNDFNLTPAQVKTRGDQIFTEGINHYVIHVYVHQPDLGPGIITPWFGLPMHRKNAWFFEAKSWVDYVRRCHYLLQQGRYVADVAYFMGEDTPMMAGSREPAIPPGYAYDFVNADVIMNRMRMKDGRFTLPDGLSYKLLVLPPGKTMRPETLAKLKTLVKEGGAIYGAAPERSPSLENYPACDARVQGLAGTLWSGKDEDTGKGRVFTKGGLDDVLKTLACNPDFADGGGLLWIHRQTADGDIYFVTNQENCRKQVAPVFRVDSRLQPAFWNPIDGSVTPCGLFSAEGAGVRVPMTLEPAESRFVVFSRTRRAHVAALKPAGETESAVPGALVLSDKKRVTLITWQNMAYDVTLADKKESRVGGFDLPPPQVLSDGWQTTFLEGVAGTAQSRITFGFKKPGPADQKARIMLDLGSVVNMARVVLNGKSFDTLWCAPYRLDVTDAICGGENTLEVFVTGTTAKRLGPASPVPSGVAGPVRILVGAEILLESGN